MSDYRVIVSIDFLMHKCKNFEEAKRKYNKMRITRADLDGKRVIDAEIFLINGEEIYDSRVFHLNKKKW